MAGNLGAASSADDCVYCIDQDGDAFGSPETIVTMMEEGECNRPETLPEGVSENAEWVFGRINCTDCDDESDLVFPGNTECSEEPTPLINGTLTHDYNCNGKHEHCEMTEGICRVNADATDCEFVPGFFPDELSTSKLNDPDNSSCGYAGDEEFRFGKAQYMGDCVAGRNDDGVVFDCTIIRESRILMCR